MGFAEIIDSDQRMIVLTTLNQDSAYSNNEYVLQAALEALGHAVSKDRMRGIIAWLNEQRLVVVTNAGDTQVVKLTAHGVDVALGRSTVPGVKRPRP